MKHITFYLDFISPFAWLAFQQLPKTLAGHSYSVDYKPVFLGALLKHHGQLGPAEISAKRDWTYRHVMWLARQMEVPLRMPATHPFNPLPLLRLASARSRDGTVNRWVCETLFRHVWQDGAEPLDAQRLQALEATLLPDDDEGGNPGRLDAEQARQQLRLNTEQAIAQGVFGVPSFVVDGRVFWGLDALPMLRDYLDGGAWFVSDDWSSVSGINFGIERRNPN